MLKENRGFTLVEVLVSLVILSLVIITAAMLMTYSTFGIFQAGEKSELLFEAQGIIEQEVAGTKAGEEIPITVTIKQNLGEYLEEEYAMELIKIEGSYLFQGQPRSILYYSPKVNDE